MEKKEDGKELGKSTERNTYIPSNAVQFPNSDGIVP